MTNEDESIREYLTELTLQEKAFAENPDWEPTPFRAANGHKMIQRTPGQTWNAYCVPDCEACADGEPLPDW